MKCHNILGLPEYASREEIETAYWQNFGKLQEMADDLSNRTFDQKATQLYDAREASLAWLELSSLNKTMYRISSHLNDKMNAAILSTLVTGDLVAASDCNLCSSCCSECCGQLKKDCSFLCCSEAFLLPSCICSCICSCVYWLGFKRKNEDRGTSLGSNIPISEYKREEARQKWGEAEQKEASVRKERLLQQYLDPTLNLAKWQIAKSNNYFNNYSTTYQYVIKLFDQATRSEKENLLRIAKRYIPNLKTIYFADLSAISMTSARQGEQVLSILDPAASSYMAGPKKIEIIERYAVATKPSFTGLEGRNRDRDQALLRTIDNTDPEIFRKTAAQRPLHVVLWYYTLKEPFDRTSYEAVLHQYDIFNQGELLHVDAAASLQALESRYAHEGQKGQNFSTKSLPKTSLDLYDSAVPIIRMNKSKLNYFRKNTTSDMKRTLASIARWAAESVIDY